MMEMRGKMVEADFEKDELTFRMEGKYYATAGTYVIFPLEELERAYKRRDPMEEWQEMRRSHDIQEKP